VYVRVLSNKSMTRVEFWLTPFTRPLLALVAPHGLTDLNKPGVFGRYACWLALPLPPKATTALFCLASVYHLCHDVGSGGSLFVHALIYDVHQLLGPQVAFETFLVYFALVHTPLHYLTEAIRGNAPLVYASLATSVLLWAMPCGNRFVLTDAAQRLVVAHIVTVAAGAAS
tara:strand:+ start:5243 stop:5755 length:513 start_codon:yes stop_codon:yes gene_type:complete